MILIKKYKYRWSNKKYFSSIPRFSNTHFLLYAKNVHYCCCCSVCVFQNFIFTSQKNDDHQYDDKAMNEKSIGNNFCFLLAYTTFYSHQNHHHQILFWLNFCNSEKHDDEYSFIFSLILSKRKLAIFVSFFRPVACHCCCCYGGVPE